MYYYQNRTFVLDAANIAALRSGTTAQELRVYNTYTDASNYERAIIQWSGGELFIGTNMAGSGSSRGLSLMTAGLGRWNLTTAGNFIPRIDNGYSFGDVTHNIVGVNAYTLRLKPVTFAGLPASPVQGWITAITDGSTATWGATVAGGGANKVTIQFNGTNWTVIGA